VWHGALYAPFVAHMLLALAHCAVLVPFMGTVNLKPLCSKQQLEFKPEQY
jgi:hypothetical protein